jgi:hypothetical protein
MVISFVVLSVKVSAGEAEADGRDLVEVGEFFCRSSDGSAGREAGDGARGTSVSG